MNKKHLNYLINLIKFNKNEEFKSLNKNSKKFNFHTGEDYLLYIAAFYDNLELQHFLIEIGLEPEKTAGRLKIAFPEKLEKLRNIKQEQEIKTLAKELNGILIKKELQKKLKI